MFGAGNGGEGGGLGSSAAEPERHSDGRLKVRRVGENDVQIDMFKEMQIMNMMMIERMNQQQQMMMQQQQTMFMEMMSKVCQPAVAPPSAPGGSAALEARVTIQEALANPGAETSRLIGEAACSAGTKQKATAEQLACIKSVAAGFRKNFSHLLNVESKIK